MAQEFGNGGASSSASTEDFGSALRRFRIASGLSQQELAQRARADINTISARSRSLVPSATFSAGQPSVAVLPAA